MKSHLDERFDAFYHRETRLGHLLWTFALLAIFVACLGLFGLTAFTAEQRTKEIGVIIDNVIGVETVANSEQQMRLLLNEAGTSPFRNSTTRSLRATTSSSPIRDQDRSSRTSSR